MCERTKAIIADLEIAARRWWMPGWLSDLLISAASYIQMQDDMEKLTKISLSNRCKALEDKLSLLERNSTSDQQNQDPIFY